MLQLELHFQRKTEVSEVRDNWNKYIGSLLEKDHNTMNDTKEFINSTEKKFDANCSLKVKQTFFFIIYHCSYNLTVLILLSLRQKLKMSG